MTPPICELCGKDFRSRWVNTEQGGMFVTFSDQRGAWFCDDHAEEALELTGLPSEKALKALCEKNSFDLLDRPKEYGPIPAPQLWLITIGPNIEKVLTIVKEATGLSTRKSLDLIKHRQGPIIDGPFQTLQEYKKRLDNIGAKADIYFNDQEIPAFIPPELSNSIRVKDKEQNPFVPEGGKSLPLTWVLTILLLAIAAGYFSGDRFLDIMFIILLLVGIVSIIVRYKSDHRK